MNMAKKTYLNQAEQQTIERTEKALQSIDPKQEIENALRDIIQIVETTRKKVFKETNKNGRKELSIFIDTKKQMIELLTSTNTSKRSIWTRGLWRPSKQESIRSIEMPQKTYNPTEITTLKGRIQEFLQELRELI